MNAVATLFTNGMIRNQAGELIGFFDAERNLLHFANREFQVIDAEHAMEIVGAGK